MKNRNKDGNQGGRKTRTRVAEWFSRHKTALIVLFIAAAIHVVGAFFAWHYYYSNKQMEIFWLLDFFDKFGIVTAALSLLVSVFTWANTRDLVKRRGKTDPTPGRHSAVLAIQCNNSGGIDKDIREQINHTPEFEILKFNSTQQGRDEENQLEKAIESANKQIKKTQFSLEPMKGIRGVFLKGKVRYIDVKQAADEELEDILDLLTGILKNQGISSLHVFYMGPVTVPFLVADYFANTFILHIYEHKNDREGKEMSYYYAATIAKVSGRE